MSAWKGHADLAASRGQHHSLWTVSTVYQGGREPCEEVLYLASWTIVVTNVPRARQRLPEALVRLATAMANRTALEAVERAWQARYLAQLQARAHPDRDLRQALGLGDHPLAESAWLLASPQPQLGQSQTGRGVDGPLLSLGLRWPGGLGGRRRAHRPDDADGLYH